MDDGDRFSYLVRKIVGKRLMYKELTGKRAIFRNRRSNLKRGPKTKADGDTISGAKKANGKGTA
jgi:hypothetical protein